MPVTWAKPKSDLLTKLVILARGNVDLVDDAVRTVQRSSEGPADLNQIIDYIVKHRRRDEQVTAASG